MQHVPPLPPSTPFTRSRRVGKPSRKASFRGSARPESATSMEAGRPRNSSDGRDPWRDSKSPAAEVCGPMSVAVANHHGYLNANGERFVRALQPKVFVVPTCDSARPTINVLNTLYPKAIYARASRCLCDLPNPSLSAHQPHLLRYLRANLFPRRRGSEAALACPERTGSGTRLQLLNHCHTVESLPCTRIIVRLSLS